MHEQPLIAPYVGELERAGAAVERFKRLAGAPDAPWGFVQKALFEERCGGILRELKNISRRVAEVSVASRGAAGHPASGATPDPVPTPPSGSVSSSPSNSVPSSAAGSWIPRCRAAPGLFPARSAPSPTPGIGGSVFVFGRAAGRTRPGDVYVAARTNERGVVVCTAGPFATQADAASFVAEQFGGQGYAVRFELVFRRG